MLEIIPAILTNNLVELKELLARAEGVVERAQIDIVDGQFAGNKTIDPSTLKDIETDLKLDFQLMVKEPVHWTERSIVAATDRIIGHIEMMRDQVEFVGKVSEVGASVGLAIDVKTPVSALDPTILSNLDVVLVMSVPAGFAGQKFVPSALAKIKELDEIRARDDTPFRIFVDGGVTVDNIKRVRLAGTDEVGIGRRIFDGDLKENIEMFMKKAYA